MLVDLDHSQSSVVVLIDYRLDAGRFARSAVSIKEQIISTPARDERLGVLNERFFLRLVSDKVVKRDLVHIRYGTETHRSAMLVGLYA